MNAQNFFDAMQFFGEPKVPENSDFAMILDAYLRKLEQYDSEVLQTAADLMLATRKHRNFPLLAECLDFCRAAQEQIVIRAQREAEKAGKAPVKTSVDPWSDHRIRQADRAMNSDIGRLAASEGWIVHLHDWCRENGRVPNGFEGEKVRTTGLSIKAEREAMARLSGSSNPIVMSVARVMASKRKSLSEKAFGRGG